MTRSLPSAHVDAIALTSVSSSADAWQRLLPALADSTKLRNLVGRCPTRDAVQALYTILFPIYRESKSRYLPWTIQIAAQVSSVGLIFLM